MCLHSRMGNNNWLKQSLLWETNVLVVSRLKVKPDDIVSTWTLTDSRGSGGRWAPPGACLRGQIYTATGAGGEGAFLLPPPSVGSAKSFISITVPWHLSDSCAPCVNCMKPERKCVSVPGTAYSSSSGRLRCGPGYCHMSWGACRGSVPRHVGAGAPWRGPRRAPLFKWEAIIKPSFIPLTCLFAFSRLIFSLSLDFFNPELFSLGKWLNEELLRFSIFQKCLKIHSCRNQQISVFFRSWVADQTCTRI